MEIATYIVNSLRKRLPLVLAWLRQEQPDINWGWPIDHILATAPLAGLCAKADVDLGPRRAPSSSDHTVVWAEFNR